MSLDVSAVPERFYIHLLTYRLDGIGPLLFAPLCEIPAIGRNGVYTPTFTLFIIICVPTAVVDNFGGLLVLRLLQGILCSPCLANGAASVGDMVSACTNIICEV
jgi:MFS family permease